MFVNMYCFDSSAPSEFYTLSLHDALPIYSDEDGTAAEHLDGKHDEDEIAERVAHVTALAEELTSQRAEERIDRKSTRLNSSHVEISYAVFCLKKKNKFIVSCVVLAPFHLF